MISPDEAALVKRLMELLGWAVLWLFAYATVLLLVPPPLRTIYLLVMTGVLITDALQHQRRRALP